MRTFLAELKNRNALSVATPKTSTQTMIRNVFYEVE